MVKNLVSLLLFSLFFQSLAICAGERSHPYDSTVITTTVDGQNLKQYNISNRQYYLWRISYLKKNGRYIKTTHINNFRYMKKDNKRSPASLTSQSLGKLNQKKYPWYTDISQETSFSKITFTDKATNASGEVLSGVNLKVSALAGVSILPKQILSINASVRKLTYQDVSGRRFSNQDLTLLNLDFLWNYNLNDFNFALGAWWGQENYFNAPNSSSVEMLKVSTYGILGMAQWQFFRDEDVSFSGELSLRQISSSNVSGTTTEGGIKYRGAIIGSFETGWEKSQLKLIPFMERIQKNTNAYDQNFLDVGFSIGIQIPF